MQQVLRDVKDGVATITLNRPKQRNAMSQQLQRELRQAMLKCEQDDAVRCTILTGRGKAFCAGVDLKEFGRGGGVDPRAKAGGEFKKGGLFHGRTKPMIAAVNGYAFLHLCCRQHHNSACLLILSSGRL